MRSWRPRPFTVLLFGLTLAAELTAIAVSRRLEPRYGTLLFPVYPITLAGADAKGERPGPPPVVRFIRRLRNGFGR